MKTEGCGSGWEWGQGEGLMMAAVLTSETPVHLNETTRRYIPEDSHLHTRRRENLKSQTCM
jgi:hypothetical protein